MVRLIRSDGICDEYVFDKEEEKNTLPNTSQGSTAFCIATQNVYMLNGEGEWIKL